MSYLTTPDLPEFSKAIISFWFRVPQASMDAAQKEEDEFYAQEDPGDPPLLLGFVPLLVFGKEGTGSSKVESENSPTPHTEIHSLHSCATVNATYGGGYPTATVAWENECTDGVYETIWNEVTVSYSAKPGKPTNPSFIAIDGGGRLRINFESTKMAEVSGFCNIISGSSDHVTSGHTDLCCHYPLADGCSDGGKSYTDDLGGLCGIIIYVVVLIFYRLGTAVADVCEGSGSGGEFVEGTAKYGPVPGDFGTGALNVSLPRGQGLAGDKWHHVLISVDMTEGAVSSGGGGISASCTMYVAIDDKDYKTGSYPLEGTNKVVPNGCEFVTGMPGGENCGPGSYSLTDMKVPAAPVGIPCVEKYVNKIRKVEMAEFQLFTGVTLDTGLEENRRLFVTGKDKKGRQHPANASPLTLPYRKFAIGDPAKWEPGADNPAYAPPLFDPSGVPTQVDLAHNKKLVTADIDFTKCAFNWMMGLNLGKTAGKVKVTGKIKAYWPPDGSDPVLESNADTGAGAEGGS